jgi:hypothetical protein
MSFWQLRRSARQIWGRFRPPRFVQRFIQRAAVAVAASAAAIVFLDVVIHTVPIRLFQDAARDHYLYNREIRENRETCPVHGYRLLRPGLEFRDRALNLRMTYRTSPLPVGDCIHGFRSNGFGDEDPLYGVVLGDSSTENITLDDREGWVSLLSSATGKRFINLSLSNVGTNYHRHLAATLLPALRPKVVLLQICDNDVLDDAQGTFPFPSELGLSSYPGETPESEPVFAGFYDEWKSKVRGFLSSRSTFLFLLLIRVPHRKRAVAAETAPRYQMTPEDVETQRSNIRFIHSQSKKIGAKMAILSFSTPAYTEALDLDSWCRENGVPLFLPTFEGQRPLRDYQFLTDGHFNLLGNQKIVRDLLREWEGTGLLP